MISSTASIISQRRVKLAASSPEKPKSLNTLPLPSSKTGLFLLELFSLSLGFGIVTSRLFYLTVRSFLGLFLKRVQYKYSLGILRNIDHPMLVRPMNPHLDDPGSNAGHWFPIRWLLSI